MVRYFRINTGSCGGCDLSLSLAPEMAPVGSIAEADLVVITGPLLPITRDTLRQLLADGPPRPILALGRCAIDGHPFGKGGVTTQSDLQIDLRLDGCPPTPQAIRAAIGSALGGGGAPTPEKA